MALPSANIDLAPQRPALPSFPVTPGSARHKRRPVPSAFSRISATPPFTAAVRVRVRNCASIQPRAPSISSTSRHPPIMRSTLSGTPSRTKTQLMRYSRPGPTRKLAGCVRSETQYGAPASSSAASAAPGTVLPNSRTPASAWASTAENRFGIRGTYSQPPSFDINAIHLCCDTAFARLGNRVLDRGNIGGIAVAYGPFHHLPQSDYRPTRRIEGRPRVIVTRRLLPETEARMAELFDVTLNPDDRPRSADELKTAMQTAHVLVPTVTDRIDADLIAAAGPQLGLIASFGAGTDHIDLAAARARKILVTNTPGVFTDDTADMTLSLIIAVSRRLAEGGRVIRSGNWAGWAPATLLGHRISGKRLGIIGMGRIGQAVAHRARAFGLEIVYHNRQRLPEAFERMVGAHYEPDIDTLVRESDIVTLHCPATPETRLLMDARRIALMKPEAYLVNTARGDVVEEDALIKALAGRPHRRRRARCLRA